MNWSHFGELCRPVCVCVLNCSLNRPEKHSPAVVSVLWSHHRHTHTLQLSANGLSGESATAAEAQLKALYFFGRTVRRRPQFQFSTTTKSNADVQLKKPLLLLTESRKSRKGRRRRSWTSEWSRPKDEHCLVSLSLP